MKDNYRNESMERIRLGAKGQEGIVELERKVFSPIGVQQTAYRQAAEDIKRIEEEMKQAGTENKGYSGKLMGFVSKFLPTQTLMAYRTSRLESSKAELEKIRDRNH